MFYVKPLYSAVELHDARWDQAWIIYSALRPGPIRMDGPFKAGAVLALA